MKVFACDPHRLWRGAADAERFRRQWIRSETCLCVPWWDIWQVTAAILCCVNVVSLCHTSCNNTSTLLYLCSNNFAACFWSDIEFCKNNLLFILCNACFMVTVQFYIISISQDALKRISFKSQQHYWIKIPFCLFLKGCWVKIINSRDLDCQSQIWRKWLLLLNWF